jgi:hypothetical protein
MASVCVVVSQNPLADYFKVVICNSLYEALILIVYTTCNICSFKNAVDLESIRSRLVSNVTKGDE